MQVPISTVQSDVKLLRKKHKILPRKQGKKPLSPAPPDLTSDRNQTIIAMKKNQATLKEIGEKLTVTSERARQLIAELIEWYGEEIFSPDTPEWSLPEAATMAGVDYQIARRLCAAEAVPYRLRGEHGYFLDEVGIQQLRLHPIIWKERQCPVCENWFDGSGTGAITCSEECADVRKKQQREECLQNAPTAEALQGWQKDLWLSLQNNTIPEGEEWITLGEAGRLTGLSKMQLSWLRMRKIVAIHRDPAKIARRTGKPMALYSTSEMKIAKEVYQQFESNERRE